MGQGGRPPAKCDEQEAYCDAVLEARERCASLGLVWRRVFRYWLESMEQLTDGELRALETRVLNVAGRCSVVESTKTTPGTEAGLTPTAQRVLRILRQSEVAWMPRRELARLVGVSDATLSASITQLRNRALVETRSGHRKPGTRGRPPMELRVWDGGR